MIAGTGTAAPTRPSCALHFVCNGLLNRFGKVEDAVVMYDKKTGRSRGFGFITYDNPDIVRKVGTCCLRCFSWGCILFF